MNGKHQVVQSVPWYHFCSFALFLDSVDFIFRFLINHILQIYLSQFVLASTPARTCDFWVCGNFLWYVENTTNSKSTESHIRSLHFSCLPSSCITLVQHTVVSGSTQYAVFLCFWYHCQRWQSSTPRKSNINYRLNISNNINLTSVFSSQSDLTLKCIYVILHFF